MIKFLKLIFLSLLCGIFFISVQAQNQQQIDSLQNLLNKHTVHDTTYMKMLKDYAYMFAFSDHVKFKKNIEQALAIADSLHFQLGIIQCYYALGISTTEHADKKDAIKLFEKCLQLAVKAENKVFIASCYGALARIYYQLGNPDSSISNYERSTKIFDEMGRKGETAVQLNGLAVVYEFQGKLEKALSLLQKAENILSSDEKILKGNDRFTPFLVSVYLNISEMQTNFGNLKSGIEYAHKAIAIAQRNNYKRELGFANFVLAGIEITSNNNYKEGISYCRKAYGFYKEIDYKDRMAMVANLMGEAFIKLENADSAEFYYRRGMQLSEEVHFVQELTNALKGMGMAKNLKRNYIEAIEYLLKALDKANEVNDNLQKKEILAILSDAYYKNGNSAKAFESLKSYTLLKDSILDGEKQKSINELSTKFESEKKDNKILVLTKDSEIQTLEIKKQKLLKNSFIGGLFLLLILSFFVYNNFRVTNKLKLQNIRNRIASDLHDDVGSTLNSISVYSEVAKQKSPTVVDELEHIGDASRKIIEVMSDIVWTINPKNDTFENIILRMSTLAYNLLKAKNIEHTFRADESLNETKLSLELRRNFYLIFKEALNNLVKYSNATRASITLTSEKGLIKLAVRDNGVGFEVAQTSTGNGLLNMKARAEEMNAQLKIESEKGSGTNIELILKS